MKLLLIMTLVALALSSVGFKKCVWTVPVMIPLIPLYSVEKYKWLVA